MQNARSALIVLGALLLITVAASWIMFPAWRQAPWGVALLVAVAGTGVVVFLRNLAAYMKDFSELASGDSVKNLRRPEDSRSGALVTDSDAYRNIEATAEDGPAVVQRSTARKGNIVARTRKPEDTEHPKA